MKSYSRLVLSVGAFLFAAALAASPPPVRSSHHGRIHVSHGRPSSFHHRIGWGWRGGWGWGWGWPGWYAGYYGPPYGYGAYGYGAYAPADWAAVDTDVSPEEARVYLDGRYIGIADDFDGYPDYLYLRPGNYKLEFRLDGYETRMIDVKARPGFKLDIKESLRKVPGAKSHGSYDTPEPEGGVRRFWGKEKDVPTAIDVEPDSGRYRDWRDRGNGPDASAQPPDAPESPESLPEPPAAAESPAPVESHATAVAPVPSSKARLRFRILPGDAAVYIDDRFAGTGEELSSLSRGLLVSAGPHRIVVSRPGYATEQTQVELMQGKSETVDLTLQRP